MANEETQPAGRLSEDQQRHLLVGLQYVDKMLADIERILAASSTKSPFPRYRTPLRPEQRAFVEERIAAIRARIVRALGEHAVPIRPGDVDAVFAIRSALRFADLAVEELNARHMRRYGELDPAAEPDLKTLDEDLRGMVRALDDYLAEAAS
jgi:hypothetical protein